MRSGVLYGAWDVYQALRLLRPDVVHIHGRLQAVAPAALYRQAFNPQARVVITFHTMPHVRDYLEVPSGNGGEYAGPRKVAARFLLANCDRVTAVSHSIVHSLRHDVRLPIGNYDVVRAGSEHEPVDSSRVEAARALWPCAGRTPILSTVGVLSWDWKVAGHKLCMEALPHVKATFSQVQLLVAGDGRYRQYLQAVIEAHGLQNDVRLLGNVDDVPALLNVTDLYVHMGLNEGSPHAIIEAMAAGKPIVAARAAGIPEIVEDGKTGLLVEPDPRSVADGVLRLLSDRPLARRLAQAAYAYARSHLTWRRVALDCIRIYRSRKSDASEK